MVVVKIISLISRQTSFMWGKPGQCKPKTRDHPQVGCHHSELTMLTSMWKLYGFQIKCISNSIEKVLISIKKKVIIFGKMYCNRCLFTVELCLMWSSNLRVRTKHSMHWLVSRQSSSTVKWNSATAIAGECNSDPWCHRELDRSLAACLSGFHSSSGAWRVIWYLGQGTICWLLISTWSFYKMIDSQIFN